MPLRPATPDELKELGVAMATPQPTSPVASNQFDQPTNFRALSQQMSQQAAATSNPLTYNAPPATPFDKVVLGMGPAMATTALGGNMLKGAVAAGSKLAPYAEAAGQGLGNMALEGFNYLTQPADEKPTLTGASLRSAAQAAIPLGFGKLSEGIAPLAQKMQPMLSRITGPGKEVLEKVGSGIKTVMQKGLDETTAARQFKDTMLADLEQQGIRLPVQPVIDALKNKFVPYAENEMKGLINGLQKAAEPLDNSISLPKFQELIRAARRQAKMPAAKDAFAAFNEEFKNSVAAHIAEHAQGGQTMAQDFISSFDETTQRLKIFENVKKIVQNKQAINAAKSFLFDDGARTALKAMDEEVGYKTGEGFLPQIEKLRAEAIAAERRGAERGIAADKNAELLILQKRARNLLYSLVGTATALATRGVYGVIGGSTLPFASMILNRFAGEAFPIESAAARMVGGLSKAAPAATAAVNQATRAPFDEVQGGGGTPK